MPLLDPITSIAPSPRDPRRSGGSITEHFCELTPQPDEHAGRQHLVADVHTNEHGSKIYQLHGVLFFASVTRFRDLFDPQNDPDDVVIDFYFSRVYDQSGLEAINNLAERYQKLGKRLHLRHLSEDCRRLLERAGEFVEVNISEDPHYHVATDRTKWVR
ncbi:MAG: sodium-independent anion transporter [Phycisphaerales bacterium]|nr:MAG: sodium-independent anion transporter [Phycisphaerales bacterium]